MILYILNLIGVYGKSILVNITANFIEIHEGFFENEVDSVCWYTCFILPALRMDLNIYVLSKHIYSI